MTASKVNDARQLLTDLGLDAERSNERSALVLLAMLRLAPGDAWAAASNPAQGTRAIMDWIRDQYQVEYAANTRETVRRFTLHQFVTAGLVEENHDQPDRPVNSPKWNYRVSPPALEVIKEFGGPRFRPALEVYLSDRPTMVEAYLAARVMSRIPVTFPGGRAVTLSPGGQNVLIKAMLEEFCPRYTPGAEVLYLGDADSKMAVFEQARLAALGVRVDRHGKMPDLVVHFAEKGWLVLMEAASSHGPVDGKRHAELEALFAGASPGLVHVSCFPSRAEMRKYLAAIAWETEVWCADAPDHLIHFNGSRFLGPYS